MTIPGHCFRWCGMCFLTASGTPSDPKMFMNNHQLDCRFRILVLGKVSADTMARLRVKLLQQPQSGKSSLISAVFGVEMAVGALFFESSFRLSNPSYRRHQKVSTETPISTSPSIQTTTVISQYTSILDSMLSTCRLFAISSRITGAGDVQTWRNYVSSGRLILSSLHWD